MSSTSFLTIFYLQNTILAVGWKMNIISIQLSLLFCVSPELKVQHLLDLTNTTKIMDWQYNKAWKFTGGRNHTFVLHVGSYSYCLVFLWASTLMGMFVTYCLRCKKGFQFRGSLNLHLWAHRGERSYSCRTCGRHHGWTFTLCVRVSNSHQWEAVCLHNMKKCNWHLLTQYLWRKKFHCRVP